MHALGQFIEQRAREEGGLSVLGRKAGLSRSRMSQFVKDPVKVVPGGETLTGLSRALGIPVPAVVGLALNSVGLPWPQPLDAADKWPAIVLDNWHNKVVVQVWLANLPEAVRLGMIRTALGAQDTQGDEVSPVSFRPAANGGTGGGPPAAGH